MTAKTRWKITKTTARKETWGRYDRRPLFFPDSSKYLTRPESTILGHSWGLERMNPIDNLFSRNLPKNWWRYGNQKSSIPWQPSQCKNPQIQGALRNSGPFSRWPWTQGPVFHENPSPSIPESGKILQASQGGLYRLSFMLLIAGAIRLLPPGWGPLAGGKNRYSPIQMAIHEILLTIVFLLGHILRNL